ncbi:hypothetical protein FOL47_010352, partial [Perkinsus chesapeaki]
MTSDDNDIYSHHQQQQINSICNPIIQQEVDKRKYITLPSGVVQCEIVSQIEQLRWAPRRTVGYIVNQQQQDDDDDDEDDNVFGVIILLKIVDKSKAAATTAGLIADNDGVAATTTMHAGTYKIGFKCKNPDELTNGKEIKWTIESYFNIDAYPIGGASIADTKAVAYGLPINAEMGNMTHIINDPKIL